MNRLQKRAKLELGMLILCCLICFVCFSFLVARNSKGLDYLLIILVVLAPITFLSFQEQRRFEKQLDEREFAMYRNASLWSVWAFVGFQLVFTFSVFFLIGGGGQAPVWYFPAMLMGSVLIAQATQSAILLFWCDKEQSNG